MKNKRLMIILMTAAILLLIPFIAMQLTNEVDWKTQDFTIMGVLLLSTGLLSELVIRRVKSTRYRIIICASILFLFFLVWAELAVGIFGTQFAGSQYQISNQGIEEISITFNSMILPLPSMADHAIWLYLVQHQSFSCCYFDYIFPYVIG